jgi:16S rRNA processing protein RimM
MPAWGALASWWISDASEPETASTQGWREVKLIRAQVVNGRLHAKLDGVDDRNASEALKGWYVGALREALPEPGLDEYYWDDLIGLAVRNQHDESLGHVTGLLETGANHVMTVEEVVPGQAAPNKRLIPFLGHVIVRVDRANKVIVVEWERDW